MLIHIDITELVVSLRRTGIQRVERELIRHWPGPVPLRPCWFDPRSGQLCALPDAVLPLLTADMPPEGHEAEAKAVASLMKESRRLDTSGLHLLNAELFFDLDRASLYMSVIGQGDTRVHWLLYDFLPWLYPQFFHPGAARAGMGFLRALRYVPRVAFISEQVRDDYRGRIMRGRGHDGPVLPLGGDGLGIERQTFTPARTDFVWLGTIEPRKNASAVLRAFMQLWANGLSRRFVMIGRTESTATEETQILHQLRHERRFRHIEGASDATIRDCLQNARAVIFPSQHEGFGLPAIEALHCGIPVIAWRDLPALRGLPSAGQVRLADTSADAIAGAVQHLSDDVNARQMWAEAATLAVPEWRDFAVACAAWVQA